jgi:carboxyl-terminal processing protease
MIKQTFIYLALLIQLVGTACAGDSTHVTIKKIVSEEQQPMVYQAVAQLVSNYHYNKLKIDDAFSSKVLDNYIKHLDQNRLYFTADDIKSFEKFRYGFDDAVFNTNIQPIFDIYNVYQQRIAERINYSLNIIKQDFDFNANDSFMIDREKAPWFKDTAEQNKVWYHKIKYECLTIRSTGKDYKSYSETIRKRYENYEKQVSKTKSEDAFGLFMNSLVELADPHTNYFSPRIAEDFNNSISLSLEGIGAQLRTDGENTKVVEVIKGGPADKSKKIFANDKIIGVSQSKDSDMTNVIDWRIDDVVALIRGKKGTLVRLEIVPASDPTKTKIIELIRDKIKLEDQASKSTLKEVKVNGKKLKIGVVTVPTFYIDFAAAQRHDPNYTSTTRDVKKFITEFKKQHIDGLVIDLRNNGGGSLQEAIDLTGLFIKSGPVVQVKDANGSERSESDLDGETFYDGPLTVLVNRFSASASEIFAAAIQDYGRGVIIGERTYGKGTVQNVVNLNDMIHINNKTLGQVKITIAKFYRINGSSTQHKGVSPDVEFPGVFDDDKYGEDASPFALPWDQIGSSEYEKTGTVDFAKPILIAKHTDRMRTNPEYKYLTEDIAYIKKVEANNYITLNEKKYKEQTEESEKIKKKREEERKAITSKEKKGEENKDATDLILSESEQVIGDLLELKK